MNPFVFELLVAAILTLAANGLFAVLGRKFIFWFLVVQAYGLLSPIALFGLISLSGNIIRYGGDRIAGSYAGFGVAWVLTIIVFLLLRSRPRHARTRTV